MDMEAGADMAQVTDMEVQVLEVQDAAMAQDLDMVDGEVMDLDLEAGEDMAQAGVDLDTLSQRFHKKMSKQQHEVKFHQQRKNKLSILDMGMLVEITTGLVMALEVWEV